MSSLITLAEKTRDWLKQNPKECYEPEHFFGIVWTRYKIVSIGERHVDAAHREFIAKMVQHWGSASIGLALEIQASHQPAINQYMQQGHGLPIDQWFTRDAKFLKILQAARLTQTHVLAMDQTQKPLPFKLAPGPMPSLRILDRDKHMADAIGLLRARTSKMLVLAGMEHTKEASFGGKPPLGVRLVKTVGSAVYTIYAMTQHPQGHASDPLFKVLQAAFGPRGAIAFDIDRSPLADAKITDSVAKRSISWKDYCDGLMLFFKP